VTSLWGSIKATDQSSIALGQALCGILGAVMCGRVSVCGARGGASAAAVQGGAACRGA